MKKTLFLAIAAVLFMAAAQESRAQISIGAGSGERIFFFKDAQGIIKPGSAPTLSVDFEANFRLSKTFAFSVGADVAGVAGYHFMQNNSINLGEIYLEAPVRAKVYIPLGSQVDLYLFGGPVPSLDLLSIDAHAKGSTNNFETNPNLTRLDVMLGGGIGIEIIKHIRATLGYDHGLMDRDLSANTSVHTSVLKFAAYYMF